MTNLELPDGSNEHGSDITSSVEEKLAKEGVAVISPDSLLGRIGKISKRVAVPAAAGLTLLLATALPSDSDVGVSEIFPEPTASPEASITQVENTGEILSSKTDTGQKKDTEDLRRSIEEEFGIKLHTFDEISLIPVIKVRHGVKNLFSSNQDWTEQNLNLLVQVLARLPKDLYSQREDGEKVHIILGPAGLCGWDKQNLTPNYPRQIMLPYDLFKTETPLSAEWITAHEAAHLRTLDSCSSLDPAVIQTSPYFKRIDEILERQYIEIREELSKKLADLEEETGIKARDKGKAGALESIKNPEELTSFRFTRFKYGISKDMPTEFIAVAAESYFLGKDYFYRMYEPFLPKETIDNLYEFTQNEIFGGRDYQDYKKFTSEFPDGSGYFGDPKDKIIGPSVRDQEEVNTKP